MGHIEACDPRINAGQDGQYLTYQVFELFFFFVKRLRVPIFRRITAMEEYEYKRAGKLLNRKELAARWGCCIETIKRMQSKGALPPVVFTGRLIRYRIEDIKRIEENILLLPRGGRQWTLSAK
jgi:hypothetical protein